MKSTEGTRLNAERVEWSEERNGEIVQVIAERESGNWRFFEERAWEVCWDKVPSNDGLVAKARKLATMDPTKVSSDSRLGSGPRCDSLEVAFRSFYGERVVIQARGDLLCERSAERLLSCINAFKSGEYQEVLIDFGAVQAVNEAGLRAVVEACSHNQAGGTVVRICNASDRLQGLLVLTQRQQIAFKDHGVESVAQAA